MTLTIDLSPEEERRLRERASKQGQDMTTYVHRLIARSVQTVDEALAPFRREIEESGISDEELYEFFEEVRDEVWSEKQKRSGQAS